MASKGKAQPKKAAKKNGYEMPKPLKPGDVLNDNQKNQWKVGVSIGVGGFGEIYSACNTASAVKKVDDYPYVVKIVSYPPKTYSCIRNFTIFVIVNFLGAEGEWPVICRDAFLHAQCQEGRHREVQV
jgi:hypothetical protein